MYGHLEHIDLTVLLFTTFPSFHSVCFLFKFICVHVLVCSQALSSGPSITQKKSKTKKEPKPQGMSDFIPCLFILLYFALCRLPFKSLGSVAYFLCLPKLIYLIKNIVILGNIFYNLK